MTWLECKQKQNLSKCLPPKFLFLSHLPLFEPIHCFKKRFFYMDPWHVSLELVSDLLYLSYFYYFGRGVPRPAFSVLAGWKRT